MTAGEFCGKEAESAANEYNAYGLPGDGTSQEEISISVADRNLALPCAI
jgi:hypothetical protein